MGEHGGWVKLMRATVSDPLLNKDPEHLALWIHLLCNAAYEPANALLGGKLIVLQPGQFTTGRKQLSVNSGISESKVERILKAFENAHLIGQQMTNKNRLISILSWSKIQDGEQQDGQQMDNHRTTIGQQSDTLEETKNSRKQEDRADKPPRSRFVPPSVDTVLTYCRERKNSVDAERFVNFYQAKGWMVGKSKMKDWKAAVRTWEQKAVTNQGTPAQGTESAADWQRVHPEWLDQSTWVCGADGVYRPEGVSA